jgi:hypothetical protein
MDDVIQIQIVNFFGIEFGYEYCHDVSNIDKEPSDYRNPTLNIRI